MEARNARWAGTDTLPYSPTQEAPAAMLSKRSMSSSGTSMITAFQSSGCCSNSTPMSRPPLEPPRMPSRRGEVIFFAIRSRPTAAKSS